MPNNIELDLDRVRIRAILSEAYIICREILETDFNITAEDFIAKMDVYLDSNRVTTIVHLSLSSRKYPNLQIEVDPRRKSVIARLSNRDKRIILNRYLRVL